MPWRRVPQICVSSSSWHCPPLRWLAWPFGYRRSETQHFLDHCWLVSFKVCTLTGFHSAVVQELTPADCESLNRTWDSCGAPIHSQRLLRQGKDARSKFLALWEQMADLLPIFELCSRSLQVQTISSSQDRSLLVSCLWFVLASFCWIHEVSRVTHFSDIVSCLQAASLKAGTCVSSVRCIRSQHPLR